ncbi:MAG: RNA polymerase sigma factor [Candidatus Eisenbacteria sp.]|nr:RNA polymerase sigma factor [Candidatus Eisenbacteria bacterium]
MWSSAYEHHRPAILGFLRRRLPRPEEAEDLCQETFARALRAGDRLRDRTRVRAYLFRIAHNLLVNHLRRHGRERIESDLGEQADLATLVDSGAPSPAAETELRRMTARLQELTEDLPAEQRLAFELGVLQRQPYARVAAATGWSIAKVKVCVFRARKQLIAGLGDYRPAAAGRRRRNDDHQRGAPREE